MSRSNDTEKDITNYDCIYFEGRKCKALDKVYCRKEKCNFYRNKNVDKKIPFFVTKDGKVKRKTILN